MFKNTPINLANDLLSDEDIASIVSLSARDRFVFIFDPKDHNKQISLPDFGTIFIGFDENIKTIENLDCFIRNDVETPLIAPSNWKHSHLVKRIGMFPSVSQAAKNNFGSEIPAGFSQVIVRINKLRGILSILKNS